MKSEVKCKITDLLKDYVVLHERIKALYTMLEVHRYIHWYWLESNHAKIIQKKFQVNLKMT